MFLGFAGRISPEAANQFLWATGFFADLEEHFAPLHFAEIPDGLIVTLDSFPSEGSLTPAVSKMRKLRNTTVRTQSGSLVKLASLHGAAMKLNHAKLASCQNPQEVSALIAEEVREQAEAVLHKLSSDSLRRFCRELRAMSARGLSEPALSLSAQSRLWQK